MAAILKTFAGLNFYTRTCFIDYYHISFKKSHQTLRPRSCRVNQKFGPWISDYRYRFDGNIFNLRRLQAKTKVQTEVLDELLYADDMDKNASTEAKLQRAMDQVSQSCDNYDLTISTKKTEVVHQPAPGKPYNEPTITVNGQKLKVVDKFTYLGSTLSRAVHIDDEITARIAKASVAFGRLRANVESSLTPS